MPRPRATAVTLVTRTVLWIVISSIFLFTNVRRMQFERAHGVQPGVLSWALLLVWVAALLFWLYTGWRDWTKRVR